MNAKEVYEILINFINNDHAHLKKRVDWIFALLIGNLCTLVGALAVYILTQ